MVVGAQHVGDPDDASEVEITYVRDGKAEKVRTGHCAMACYNGVVPHLVPEMSDTQKGSGSESGVSAGTTGRP